MKGLEALKQKYQWPSDRPYDDLDDWSLDGGGKRIVSSIIRQRPISLMVEIGSFVGGSAKIWLNADPRLQLICVDPWEGDWWVDYGLRNGRERFAEVFAQPDGPFLAFASVMWAFRDRVIPVKGRSPEVLEELHGLGIQPELFFLDSNKSGQEMEVCERLFPTAILTGDDWTWGTDGKYPIQEAVKQFSTGRNYVLQVKDATWILHRGPLSRVMRSKLVVFRIVQMLRLIRRKVFRLFK